MARIHGVALLDQYPDSAAARRIGPGLQEVKAKAEAAREQRRMESLWDYAQVSADGGTQRSAAILSKDPVDVANTLEVLAKSFGERADRILKEG